MVGQALFRFTVLLYAEPSTDSHELFVNDFADLKGTERVHQMQHIARRGLERMERQASSKVSEGVGKVIDVVQISKEFIGNALQSCPPAALAWAGVCLIILPVSSPQTML